MFDIKTGGVGSAMAFDQMQRDAAGATADIEDGPVLERKPLDHPVDLFRPARRQVAIAPQRFEEADGGIVIFRLGFHRFDHQPSAPIDECLFRTPAKRNPSSKKRNIIC
ncbi:hypothetical protein [Mesorhizobium sp. ESP7-2]|uniref:hypothetical protein n=1 Tax=Mesorhizobium sp. ESP7-2 TaxID=2876622 RepID=UPI0021E26954|nr:hypothetical protein [Mesorhizobium sp. ESP7-2]